MGCLALNPDNTHLVNDFSVTNEEMFRRGVRVYELKSGSILLLLDLFTHVEALRPYV